MFLSNKFPLLLASGSPARKKLLQQIGIVPELVLAPEIEEQPKKKELPAAYSKRIAIAKCEKAMNLRNDYIVLAADTVAACGRRIIPKARSAEEVFGFISLLSGRQHRVYTTVCLGIPGIGIRIKHSCTKIKFKRLSKDEIEQYIALGEWQGKAGSYAIQGVAAAFIEQINGSYSGVVGLPLCKTVKLLQSY